MGSTTAMMSIGLRAMLANQAALQTTGHNIANASVEGYSRQRVELATASPQYTPNGFLGRGADVQTVTRMHSDHLTREAAASRSLASMDAARLEVLQQIETVFPVGEAGLGQAMGGFLDATVDLANRPGDTAARQVVLARAQDTASRFASADEQLDAIQRHLGERIADSVGKVNDIARGIAEVNRKITALEGLGQPVNDLRDRRDQLIASLGEHIQVTTIPASDGSIGVFVAGGQRLVLGDSASPLLLQPDPEDPSRTAIAVREGELVRTLPAAYLGGGTLAGLLTVQSQDLVSARTQLGQMAAAFADAVNQQQARGLDLGNPPAAGGPIFTTGGTRVVASAGNERDVNGAFVAQVALAVDDASQLVASEYELRADPGGAPGAWQLTRRADGLVRTIADGDTVDGFTVSLGTPPPAATDRFLLKPVSAAADGMRVALGDPRGIAAALPVTATLAADNTGTARVASLTVASSAIDPEQTASIVFTSATGDYSWELRDRATDTLLGSGTGTWTAGEPIELNGFELRLDGVPRSGDALTVAKTAHPAANNGNALALAGLRDLALVGRSLQPSGEVGAGRSFTEAYASAMADVGVRVQGARVTADVSAGVAAQAEQTRAALSGVNLDEEAARLLAFQQSYQAAAKVLQVAQSVFDTLLETTRT